MKKILIAVMIALIAVNAAGYSTDYNITVTKEKIPKQEFWHWIVIDWNYDGPTADQNWRECDFEKPGTGYGIYLNSDGSVSLIYLIGEIGPITSTPVCTPNGATTKCTATTIYLFKLKTPAAKDAYVPYPINIKGKCGVTDSQEIYPININYTYAMTLNSFIQIYAPNLSITKRWGKISPSPEKAELNVEANAPLGKNVNSIEWTIPFKGCNFTGTQQDTGIGTPNASSQISLTCTQTGIKAVVVKAATSDGNINHEVFLTYFSDNDEEIEVNSKYPEFIELSNVGWDTNWSESLHSTRINQPIWIEYQGTEQNFDYRLSQIKTKTFTIIKNTGTGLGKETASTTTVNSSEAFTSIQNPVCPYNNTINSLVYSGNDFNIIEKTSTLSCEPGTHNITLASTGKYSEGAGYEIGIDLNFIVLDLNIQVLGMKTNQTDSTLFGLLFGNYGGIDLNIIIDNYSPEYTEITDVNLFYFRETTGVGAFSLWSDPEDVSCTTEQTEKIQETETRWKINSHLTCTKSHLFAPQIYLTNYPVFRLPAIMMFQVYTPNDLLRTDSVTITNYFDAVWNPDQNTVCGSKGCEDVGTVLAGGEVGIQEKKEIGGSTAFIVLPEDHVKVNKGDLLGFTSIVTDLGLPEPEGIQNATTIVSITDSAGNEVAELSQIEHLYFEKTVFNRIFYDTGYLNKNELYMVTATVYWTPDEGFSELDTKPLNNTQIAYFYVLGDSISQTALDETGFAGIIIALLSVLLILSKK